MRSVSRPGERLTDVVSRAFARTGSADFAVAEKCLRFYNSDEGDERTGNWRVPLPGLVKNSVLLRFVALLGRCTAGERSFLSRKRLAPSGVSSPRPSPGESEESRKDDEEQVPETERKKRVTAHVSGQCVTLILGQRRCRDEQIITGENRVFQRADDVPEVFGGVQLRNGKDRAVLH